MRGLLADVLEEPRDTIFFDYFFLRSSGDGGVILALRGNSVHPIMCVVVECEGLYVEDPDTNEMGRESFCTQCWISSHSE